MSQGDYRDGTSISFQPRPQTTKAWSRTLGALVLIGALAFSGWSLIEDRAAYPALTGGLNASGMLSAPTTMDDGVHATVTFLPADTVVTATTILPSTEVVESNDGHAYKVYYLEGDTSTTFIDGLDEVQIDWTDQKIAGGAAGLGLILLVLPFKIRTRVRRPLPEGRHRD